MSDWMPLALARAIHDETEQCEESVDIDDCVCLEADIEQAFRVLRNLRRHGWIVMRDPAGTLETGL